MADARSLLLQPVLPSRNACRLHVHFPKQATHSSSCELLDVDPHVVAKTSICCNTSIIFHCTASQYLCSMVNSCCQSSRWLCLVATSVRPSSAAPCRARTCAALAASCADTRNAGQPRTVIQRQKFSVVKLIHLSAHIRDRDLCCCKSLLFGRHQSLGFFCNFLSSQGSSLQCRFLNSESCYLHR